MLVYNTFLSINNQYSFSGKVKMVENKLGYTNDIFLR